jgi:hypothetical protein
MHAYEMHADEVSYTFMCEVHVCICKMHVYEIYATVGAHLGGTCLGDVLLALASLLPTVPMS